MADFTGRVVVVTGGSSGVGLAAANRFAHGKALVVIAGRNPERLAAAVKELEGETGAQVLGVPTDVAKADDCKRLIDAAIARFGRVDILVNNAGNNIKARTLRELTPAAWDAMMRANLDGAFYCLNAVLPGMLARKSGLVINTVSVAGKRANPLGGAAYVAAKFGVGSLGLVLGNEEKDSGVRSCNIYPGEIDTGILNERPTAVSDAQRAAMLKPDDVAAAIVWVAGLPPHVSVPELVIKPTVQGYF